MAQSNIRIPSIAELKTAYSAPESFDQSAFVKSAVTGMTLQDAILAKKLERQKQEEELKKDIQAALARAQQQKRENLFIQQPTKETATAAYPDVAAKPMLEAPKKNYGKIGETENQIILADLTNPQDVVRVDAPGVGTKAGGARLGNIAQSRILQQSGVEGVLNELTAGVKNLPSGLGGAGLAKVQAMAGGRLGGSAKVTAYDKLRDSVAVAIYKFISGDVGNIAASESKMARDLVPAIMDSPEVRQEKLNILTRAANRAKLALNDLIQSGKANGLTQEELRKAQISIADNAIAEASAETLNTPETPEDTPDTGNAAQIDIHALASSLGLKKRGVR